MAKLLRRLRNKAGLPPTFTLDACRHGGMTERKLRSRMVKAALFLRTRAEPMKGMPSERSSQVILENIERASGQSRVAALAGQHFDGLAWARNNSPPVDDMAKRELLLARLHRQLRECKKVPADG
jgi:hypothetical protein